MRLKRSSARGAQTYRVRHVLVRRQVDAAGGAVLERREAVEGVAGGEPALARAIGGGGDVGIVGSLGGVVVSRPLPADWTLRQRTCCWARRLVESGPWSEAGPADEGVSADSGVSMQLRPDAQRGTTLHGHPLVGKR